MIAENRDLLVQWYIKTHRKLPWREAKDPYAIWISEIMLQQTRAAAVISYYQSFLKRFPNVHNLAQAAEEEVLEQWAGLGYYSRARNIHKAAKLFSQNGFPKNYKDLKEYPGIGDYTSRAISSFAFQEAVGVLDGNVIRFLSRFHYLPLEHWKTEEKNLYQEISDEWAHTNSSIVNQALMEIGASLCIPQNPHCNLCPVAKDCLAREHQAQTELPLSKQKRENENWLFHFYLIEKDSKIAFSKDHSLPILKDQFLLPVLAEKQDSNFKAKKSAQIFSHSITHHNIQVSFTRLDASDARMRQFLQDNPQFKNLRWVERTEVKKCCQSSMVHKILERASL